MMLACEVARVFQLFPLTLSSGCGLNSTPRIYFTSLKLSNVSAAKLRLFNVYLITSASCCCCTSNDICLTTLSSFFPYNDEVDSTWGMRALLDWVLKAIPVMLRELLWCERWPILGSNLCDTLPFSTLSLFSFFALEPSFSSKLACERSCGLVPFDPMLWVERMLLLVAFEWSFLTRFMWFRLPLTLSIGLAYYTGGSSFVLYSCMATLIGLIGSSELFRKILGMIDFLSCFIGIVRSSLVFELMLKFVRVSFGSKGESNFLNAFVETSLMNFDWTFAYRLFFLAGTDAYVLSYLASYYSDFFDCFQSMSALK